MSNLMSLLGTDITTTHVRTKVKGVMDARLAEIIQTRSLNALFQPIVELAHGAISGYEGLIRGPSNSPLHSPPQLFRAAALCDRSVEVEHLCRRVTLESFARLDLPGDLFLNVSPECLLNPKARYGETLNAAQQLGIDPQRVVIELTEQQPAYDYELLRDAVQHYRAMGFRIAIDDLGEGFSSLRLWSELRPEFVKIDMHFIQGCDSDPVKLQFLRSIQEIARNAGSQVIAEGIETLAELNCVRDLGIALGQGYYFARPCATPSRMLADETAASFARRITPGRRSLPTGTPLMRPITPVAPTASIQEVCAIFAREPELRSLPVAEHGLPRGIIGRHTLSIHLESPCNTALSEKKPCHLIMNADPLLIEITTPLPDLGRILADAPARQLAYGYLVVENGRYRGIGTSQELIRAITLPAA